MAGRTIAIWLFAVLAAVIVRAAPDQDDYLRLLEARYTGPRPLPEGGIILELDTARWDFEEGDLWLAEPLSSGAVTGVLLEGSGRFEMSVPDPAELRQLRRFLGEDELNRFVAVFDRVLVRTSAPETVPILQELLAQLRAQGDPSYTVNSWALGRHRTWLKHHLHDADARTIAALRTLGDRYLRVDMRLEDHGWVTWEYDSLRREEISVEKFQSAGTFPVLEGWVSLDRERDRSPDGRPGPGHEGNLRLAHFDARIDLTKLGKGPPQGFGGVNPIRGRFDLSARYVATRSGVGALQLQLFPGAELRSVRLGDGSELEWLRYRIGQLSNRLDKESWSPELVVLNDRVLAEGDEIEVIFEYELEMSNYVPGLVWYPTPREAVQQPHTARLEFEHRPYYGVYAMGAQLLEEESRRTTRTVWEVAEPAKMIGFTFGRYPHQRRYQQPGLPPVTVFGTQGGWLSKERIEMVSRYVLGSLRFLQELYDSELPSPELAVTLIAAGHGQAFPGLLQIYDSIAKKGALGQAIHGTKELFVAHEVAHQWWGHEVGWDSYRDQWLSEAMADYSAAMYVEAELDQGDQVFRNILQAYSDEVQGSLESIFNAFARPGAVLLTKRSIERLGPIGHGWRASTSQAPSGYQTMTYRKGALVLHMIRTLLRHHGDGDQAFVQVLRQFLERHRQRRVSTSDLAALLDERLDYDWQGFMAQWVDGTEIPTLRWSASTEELFGGTDFVVAIDVTMDEVSPGFFVDVPLRLELADGSELEELLPIGGKESHFELVVSAEVDRVQLNPDCGVLARVKRR